MSMIGRTVGTYQIESEVGRGNMATVYRARQLKLDRWVAVKIVRSNDADFLRRFHREARAIAALRHPNILTIHNYGEDDGLPYIVMEYVDGGTLENILTGVPMSWPSAAKYIIPIGRALAYAHSQGIIHRDIKPANILMPGPDWPLLADFGLVKMLGDQSKVTRPGVILGTPAYFAPEQILGQGGDHFSDIYSLGIVLYELLTGSPPMMSKSPIEIMQRRVSELPPLPSHINRDITPQLETFMMRALERDPKRRYQTMEMFINDLAWLPGATGRMDTSTPQPAKATVTLDQQSVPIVGARLMIMGTGALIPLPQQISIVIGRADVHSSLPPTIDLNPHGGQSAGVSRYHAQLRQIDGQWFVEDLNSTNGTFVNEAVVVSGQPVPLKHGDQIRCSRLTLVFYAG